VLCVFNSFNTVFKNSIDWEWFGFAHEIIKTETSIDTLNNIKIITYLLSSENNMNKLNRNKEYLLQELKYCEENSIDKYHAFISLGQTYRELGNSEKSIEYYNKSLTIKDNYSAYIHIGNQIIDETEKIKHLFAAYQMDKNNASPLYYLGKYYSKKHKYNLAEIFLEKAMTIKYYPSFYVTAGLDYLIKIELSVVYFYLNKKEKSKQLMLEIKEQKNVPTHIQDLNHKNLTYF